ncbi:hypothetical protein HKX48_008585 [Thoreauomyces humboldtii]|nr:hypothetical protein HKX48_008585 [Thoreauomyces humboldtii]
MLDRNLHSAYDRFLWSITGNIGHFTVFVFTQFPSVTHGQRIRFPPLLEGAPESGKTFYARRFPDVRTFRHHFEEAVRRWFRAAGEREDDTEGGGAEATGLVDEETENASVTTVAYDSGDDSDRKGGEDSGDTRQMTMQDLMDSWKPLRRTESSLTIADLLGPEIDE